MKDKLNITEGKWEREGLTVFSGDTQIAVIDDYQTKLNPQWVREQSMANANFIAEAGTVANECGLTPRELLKQRDELLEAAKEAHVFLYNESIRVGKTKSRRKALDIANCAARLKTAIKSAEGK